MLPFLKKKETSGSGLIIKTRTPDEKPEQDQSEDDSSAAIESCAQELIRAVHSRDAKATSKALIDAFDIIDSMSLNEAEPHSYDAQNVKAAGEQD